MNWVTDLDAEHISYVLQVLYQKNVSSVKFIKY